MNEKTMAVIGTGLDANVKMGDICCRIGLFISYYQLEKGIN